MEKKILTNCKCESKKTESTPILSSSYVIVSDEELLLYEPQKEQLLYTPEEEQINDIKKTDLQNNEGKYYYTDGESEFLKDLKAIMKNKKLKKKYRKCQMCICGEEIEKIPTTECRIRVEAFASHDLERCLKYKTKPIPSENYESLGVLIFPVCTNDIFESDPGVPARRSTKSLWINDEEYFQDPRLEKREFAFSEAVLPPDREEEEIEDRIRECECESEKSYEIV